MSVSQQAMPVEPTAIPVPLVPTADFRMTPKTKRLVRPARKGEETRRLPATERQQLVQALHDTVCQSLTAAYLSAKFIERKSQNGAPLAVGELSDLCEMIHGVVEELQEFSDNLRGKEEAASSKGGATIH